MAKKILVVDDELDMRIFISTLLETSGYKPLKAADGKEGMLVARREKPSVVILDVMMPNESGIGMYRELKNDPALKDVPVIMVSALSKKTFYHSQKVLDEYKGENVPEPSAYIEKPPEPDELLEAIQDCLKQGGITPANFFQCCGRWHMHSKKTKNLVDEGTSEYYISTVSREVDLSQKTIREYEKMGLVKPRREPKTNNRIYSDFDIAQIRQVSHLIHNEGFTLPCLRRLLQLAPCWHVFDCDAKEDCSAYRAPHKPCYQTRETLETHCDESCDYCAIYVNRPVNRSKVLESPIPKKQLKPQRSNFVEPDTTVRGQDIWMNHPSNMNRSPKNTPDSTRDNRTLLDMGYKGIIDLLPCYLSIQDSSMNILFTNENFRKDFGDGVGRPCHAVYKGSDEICNSCPVQESFGDKRVHISEETVQLSDGEVAQLIVYSVPVPDMLGNVEAVMEMSTNITKVKKLQKELTFLGQSIAVLSHDMKNMLEGLHGGSYVIEEGLKDGDIALATRGWDIVKRNIAEISNIAQNILYSSKKRDIKCHEVSPGDIVRDVVRLFRDKAATMNIKLEYFSDPTLPSVNLDPASIRRVLSNLIWNGLEACQQDKSKDFHSVIVRADFHDQSCCMFEVEDNGIGMDEDKVDKIFEEFYSSKGSNGTGLGLFVADKIVREHGGKIEVLSSPSKGTTFRVILAIK